MRGWNYLKMNCLVDEFCFFDLLELCKDNLNYSSVFELWLCKPEKSLVRGRQKIVNDQDIRDLIAAKDKNSLVDVYVVMGLKKLLRLMILVS